MSSYTSKLVFIFSLTILSVKSFAQGPPPWERPLLITNSTDGQNFGPSATFQDSSGVPSMIKWKGDTLVAVFQWFRQPMQSITWDKVAVKFSYDNGLNWTQPVPIVVNGIPPAYQRPFDPAIAAINSDSLRIFFSSSDGYPVNGGDSIIDSYSAVSMDGVNYTFEPNARYDNPGKKVIDPSAIIFNGQWQYLAPIGAPQEGAYHCTSSDGIAFTRQVDFISDAQHNWTGNFMINDSNELRFYGCGQSVWYSSTTDGFNWTQYLSTNINGGDPATIKLGLNSYVMVYTGQPYTTSIDELKNNSSFYPNPVNSLLHMVNSDLIGKTFLIYDVVGKMKMQGKIGMFIDVKELNPGTYILIIQGENSFSSIRFGKS
jgi:hypothetical protein